MQKVFWYVVFFHRISAYKPYSRSIPLWTKETSEKISRLCDKRQKDPIEKWAEISVVNGLRLSIFNALVQVQKTINPFLQLYFRIMFIQKNSFTKSVACDTKKSKITLRFRLYMHDLFLAAFSCTTWSTSFCLTLFLSPCFTASQKQHLSRIYITNKAC